MAAIIISKILLMGTSNLLKGGMKSDAGPVSRSVFSYIKTSSHHFPRREVNNFPEKAKEGFPFPPLPGQLACIMDDMPCFPNHGSLYIYI